MTGRENYNDLHVFMLVAREGSFTKAAARLGLAQSGVSRTIRDLEARLGVQLLMRTTRSLSLTQAGEQLYRTAVFSPLMRVWPRSPTIVIPLQARYGSTPANMPSTRCCFPS
ncbi:HTH-type transcriptional regulator HdfR [Aeromonas veronii]|uniref:LysR family transcriptional regulator n=1 Tax=Aeromonas veronii TaxID=654 RepID=UPI00366A8938